MTKNINAAGQYGNSQFTVSTVIGEAAYSTIQAALNDIAGSSKTIFIYAGTYNESILWPANVSVEGASNGENTFDVTINGTQTFNGSGNVSFKNINFINSADCWTQDSVAGSGTLEFIDCKIESSAARGVVLGTTIGVSTFLLKSSEISSSLQTLDSSGNSILELQNSILSVSTDNVNTIDLAGNSSINLSGSTLNTSGIGSASCVSLNSATNSVDSRNSIYNGGNASNASAFLFTISGAFVRTVNDEMFISGATFWARSTGAFGTLSYGAILIDSGLTVLIDPQITSNTLTQVPSTSIETPVTVSDGGTGTSTLTDGGIVLGSGTEAVNTTAQPIDGQILVGSTGIDPVLNTLNQGAGMIITNAAGSVTLASTAIIWSVQASGTALLPNEGFISTSASAQNFHLPATAVVGEVFELAQNGAGLVTITQISGQSVRFGNQVTTVGVGGSLASSSIGDAIKLVCTVANTTFQVVTGSVGNWVIT